MEAAVSFICPWRLVCVIFLLPILQAVLNPEEFPNLLAGSFTDGNRLSTGNTLPLVGHPWGFNHWSPQTRDANRYTGSWWFSGSDHTLTWMRCTHQPSPWIGDWGSFVFVPQIGDVTRSPQYIWQPRGALIKPYLFDATLAPVNLRLELTATNHGAMLRVTFPATTEWGDKFICFAGLSFQDHGGANGGFFLAAVSNEVHVDRMLVNNFNHYLRAESVEATGVIPRDDLMCFQYKREATVVHVRMATSLISASQAVTNLQREIPSSATFDQTLLENKLVWNRLMRRVNVIDAGDLSERSSRHLTVFYTGLYRALTFPRRIDEVDSNGKVIHYSPYDVHGRTFSGPLVTDNGFWDTYRTVYPLLSLLYPDHLGVIVQGWLNAYKEGGWLPSWASPGYRNCMVGTFADVVIADAIVKDVPGFDIRLAIEALSKDAFENPPGYAGGAVGKEGLREYAERGYLPRELGGEIVSRTLDYGFADFSTALSFLYLSQSLAEKLPSESDVGQLKEDLLQKAKTLYRRAVSAFRSSFDQRRGLMLPKSRNGDFSDRFSPIEWGNGYTEGNAWHHSFPAYSVICPFLDVNNGFIAQLKAKSPEFSDLLKCENGLMALYGGRGGGSEELLKKLYQLLHVRSRFEVGSYGQEIHEMTESVTLAIGQYAHNNQPVHHILYLFALLGDPRTTQRLTSEVMNRGYGIDFFSGDEDNGEQGAWFVLSALGLYSISPGSLDYVVSRPLFRHVRIAHPKASHATEEVNEGMLEDYLDLFAYSTIPTRTSTKPSPSHFVHKVSVLSGKDGEGEVATIGSQQHFLISDRILQGNHILQFHYEDAEQTSDFPAQYQQLVKLLHSKPTRDLDRHQYQDFTSPPPTSWSETSSKSTVSESSLRLKLREQEKEIADLKKRLSGDSAFSHIGKIDEIRGDIPRTTASIWVFYVVLGIGFLLALAMAKLLEIAGCAEIGGGEGGSGFGCTSSYYFVVGFFRRTFLLVRSFYSRFSGNSSGGSNNEAEFIPTWSLKSQAHTV